MGEAIISVIPHPNTAGHQSGWQESPNRETMHPDTLNEDKTMKPSLLNARLRSRT